MTEETLLNGNEAAPAEGGKPAEAAPAEGAKPEDKKEDKPAAPAEGEKPAEGDKPADKKDDKPVGAPEAYTDFKAPEGVTFEPEMMGAFKSLAKENNLTQEKAQAFIDLATKHANETMKKTVADWDAKREEWKSNLKTDKEFGGDKFKATLEGANRVLRKFGSKELISTLVNTGMGDNNELVKMFARVEKALGEDTFVEGNTNDGTEKDVSKIFYPNMNKK